MNFLAKTVRDLLWIVFHFANLGVQQYCLRIYQSVSIFLCVLCASATIKIDASQVDVSGFLLVLSDAHCVVVVTFCHLYAKNQRCEAVSFRHLPTIASTSWYWYRYWSVHWTSMGEASNREAGFWFWRQKGCSMMLLPLLFQDCRHVVGLYSGVSIGSGAKHQYWCMEIHSVMGFWRKFFQDDRKDKAFHFWE